MFHKPKHKNIALSLLVIGVIIITSLILYSTTLANHRKTQAVEKSQELIANGVPNGYSYKLAPVECYESSRDFGYGSTICRIQFTYASTKNNLISIDAYKALIDENWGQWYSQPSNLNKGNVDSQTQNWLAHFSKHIEKSTLGNPKISCNTSAYSDKTIIEGECRWSHPDFYSLTSN